MKKIMLIVSLFFFTGIISIYSSVIQNYGHRGCRGLMPENTIPAYQKAMELGVDFVDMDVNMTKDGVVVVAHDTYLNPDFTKNENGNWLDSKKKIYIKDLNFAELEKYTVGEAKPGTKRALIFKDEKNIPNIHIPTLTDCIKYVKKWNAEHGTNIKINIEMKTYPFGIAHSTPSLKMAKAVYKIIKEERITDTVEVQDFDWTALWYLNSFDKNIHTAYLLLPPLGIGSNSDNAALISGYMEKDLDVSQDDLALLNNINLALLKENTGNSLLTQNQNNSVYDIYFQITKSIKQMGGHCVEPMLLFCSKDFVDASHANQLKVVPWDSEAIFSKDFNEYCTNLAIKNKVDGIITDRPDLLKKMLNNPQTSLHKAL